MENNSAIATLSRAGNVWAMRESAWIDLQSRVAIGAAAFRDDPRPRQQARGATLVIPIYGVITPKRYFFGGTALNELGVELENAIYSSKIDRIVLDVDSPGGSVAGLQEVAEIIRKGRLLKPISAVANTEAASAAYWLASQASRVYASPSSEVGSIGVWAAHQDVSKAMDQAGIATTLISAGKYKTEGHPFGPLDREARAEIQRGVDLAYANFLEAVARGRRTSATIVRRTFGEGRMIEADRAKALGMVDEVATLRDVLRGNTSAGRSARTMAKLRRLDVLAELDRAVARAASDNLALS